MTKIAIIGRPNVGKSTLFNKLVGKKRAMVHDTPGVTRDRREEKATLGGHLRFTLIDTAGLEEAAPNTLQSKMLKQTTTAADEADILILMMDGTTGLLSEDRHFAKWARKKDKKIILVVNKCERKDASLAEFYKLGFGEPIAISAEHNLGMDDLYQTLRKILPEEKEEVVDSKTIQITIAGRPNVGKSTIINKILGEERVITSDIAGTTRDSVAIDWEYKGHKMRLVDTAGLRKKANITEQLEYFSVGDTLNAVKFAHVVIFVMDATQSFEKQDMKIANHAIREGRALVVVLNKWDLVKDKKDALEEIKFQLARAFNTVPNVPYVTISALNDNSLKIILDKALETYEIWNKEIPTAQLNRWLEALIEKNAPPISHGRRIKIRYITQIKTRPPTFMLSCSQPENMPDSYIRFFTNNLREAFDLPGVPIRIQMPKKDNPFEKEK